MIPRLIRRQGMVGRIVLILFMAIVLELLGNLALHQWQERRLTSAEHTRAVARRLQQAADLATSAPVPDRARLLHSLAIDGARFNWVPRTVITDASQSGGPLSGMRAQLHELAPGLAMREMRLTLVPSDGARNQDLVGALRLDDGSFVSFRVLRFMGAAPGPLPVAILHVALITLIFLIALFSVTAALRRLRELAQAADETARNHAAPITPSGPDEVRRVAEAFAAMQARLLKTMEDHAKALIAVSHDLRTPIQRMRLRASLMEDERTGAEIAADLEMMERFIGSALAYIRHGTDEEPRPIDLASLLATVADGAADAGLIATYSGPDSLIAHVRPLAWRRALDNIADNSGKYARRLDILLHEASGRSAHILLYDDGPGIAEEDRPVALLPFRRLARPQDAAMQGSGLGLALAQRTVMADHGTLSLSSGPSGGLAVEIILPLGQYKANAARD